MSTDKRKNTAKESTRNNKSTVKDLPSKSPNKRDADQVKGGSVRHNDLTFVKTHEKSST